MVRALPSHQRADAGADERGSWDPVDCWSPEGGRIYATALNCLSMEVYYRYGRFLEVPDNSARPLPDTRPVMSATLRDAVGALTDALKSDDTEVCAVAETALNQLRAVYRTSTTPPDAPEEPKFAPESGPKFEPRALTKTAGNSAAYWAWIDKFAYACEYGDDEEVAELWTGGTKTTWVFPATVQEIRDGRVWARIDSERTYVYRFVWVRDSLGNVTKERRRWGFGPENHEFRVPEGLLGTLRVGTSVEVTIDLDPNGAKDARNGEFSAQLNIWRPSGR